MKSKFIAFVSKKQISNIVYKDPKIEIVGRDVSRVAEVKNLGVALLGQLRFENHVLDQVRNCCYNLKMLYKIRNYPNECGRVIICESSSLTKLKYRDVIYSPRLLNKTQRLIQRAQNACCRFCFKIPPGGHIMPFLNKAIMLNMDLRRHLACTLICVEKSQKPENYVES